MKWNFEPVAGPYKGATGGLAWTGKAMLFSAVGEERIMSYTPTGGAPDEYRRYTFRVNGLALGSNGELYGGQEGGRRVVRFFADGRTSPVSAQLDGRYHNFPCDLAVDKKGRVWFSDPYNPVPAYGPQLFPLLEHQSVLRLEQDRSGWQLRRMTQDTVGPRAVLFSADECTLYVADGDTRSKSPRELRAYPVDSDGALGIPTVLHTFGSDFRGAHRGIEGMCLDHEGNIIACAGWSQSGAGPLAYVFSPKGVVLETHALPIDLPMRMAFGDEHLGAIYLTAGDGCLYRAGNTGRTGLLRRG